jgi:hypothetical protein
VHQLKLYKTSLTLKAMKQYSKILSSKSQVILTHPSSNIDLLYFRTHLLFFFLFIWAIFTIMSASNEGLRYLLELQRKPPKNNSKTLSVQPWTYLFYLIPSHLDVKYSQTFPSVFGRRIILPNKKKGKKPCRPKILLTLKRRRKNTTPTGLLMFRFMIMFAWIYIY